MIQKDEIRRIAHLARLGLSEAEIEQFTKELGNILAHFEKLNEVDVSGVEEVSQITGLQNITRPDVTEQSNLSNEILQASPNKIQDQHIKVKNVF